MKPAERDQHVNYVQRELLRFSNGECSPSESKAVARDIVLHVTSRQVPRWKLLLDRLRGRKWYPVDDMFEAGLEQYVSEAIKQAVQASDNDLDRNRESAYKDGFRVGTNILTGHLLRELGLIDNQTPEVHDRNDHNSSISAGS